MPYKSERKGLVLKPEDDKRRKLTEEQKEEIRELHATGDHSQRSLALQFGVSRKSVSFIVDPAKMAAHKVAYAERQADGRYYIKEAHTKSVRKLRQRRKELDDAGELVEVDQETSPDVL